MEEEKENVPVPIELRMAIKINRVEQFNNSVPLSSKAKEIARLNLPYLEKWPLDSKIPDYRSKGLSKQLFFTRGKIGQPLLQKHGVNTGNFDLSDPKGFRTAYNLSNYDALHDPHAKHYFNSERVMNLLREQNLVNDKNEVICSTRDFNQYRQYLANIRKIELEEMLTNDDQLRQISMQIRNRFMKLRDAENAEEAEKITNARKEKAANAKLKAQELQTKKEVKGQERKQNWEKRINELKTKRQDAATKARIAQQEAHAIAEANRLQREIDQLKFRQKLLLKTNHQIKEAEDKRHYERLMAQNMKEKKEIAKIFAIQERMEEKSQEKKKATRKIRTDKSKWIDKYMEHVEAEQKRIRES